MVSLTFSSAAVQSFASKPFIQHALQNVYHPTSVLNFWFGIDITTVSGLEKLQTGSKECMSDMSALWYGGGPDYDNLCQPFADAIHMAGTKSLPSPPPTDQSNTGMVAGNTWYTTMEGNVAQIILIDQLARNVFRGTDNAFKHESISLSIARQISTEYISQLKQQGSTPLGHLEYDPIPHENNDKEPLPFVETICEKMYPGFITVIATALMHSEMEHDHRLCQVLLKHSIFINKEDVEETQHSDTSSTVAKTTKQMLHDWFQYQLTFASDHKTVIDRFGRYPHRNRLLYRTSTEDEIRWLSDIDNLPGWAKSQG